MERVNVSSDREKEMVSAEGWQQQPWECFSTLPLAQWAMVEWSSWRPMQQAMSYERPTRTSAGAEPRRGRS
jgi:hypothetical protein